MRALAREEGGFGIVELIIAMAVLSIGVLALASAFTSGAVALRRAGQIATATAIADAQLERYRALRNCAIYIDSTTVPPAGSSYWTGFSGTLWTTPTCSDTVPPQATTARQDLTPGQTPDGHRYRVDTYVVRGAPLSDPPVWSENVKTVTVIVRDLDRPTRSLAQQTSTFHVSTGV